MQVAKYLDPFSVPAQLNNLGVLVVAYVTHDVHDHSGCSDELYQNFLHFILYGSTIVCGGTFVLTILYFIGLIDFCVDRICPCGEVCLTLNTLGIFLAGTVYHCIATFYGLGVLLLGHKSQCIELQMFKQITGIIYMIWLVAIAIFLIFIAYRYCMRPSIPIKNLDERFIEA